MSRESLYRTIAKLQRDDVIEVKNHTVSLKSAAPPTKKTRSGVRRP